MTRNRTLGQLVKPGTEAYYNPDDGLWYWIDAVTGREESGTQQPTIAPPGPIQFQVGAVPVVNVPPATPFGSQLQSWLGQNWPIVAMGMGVLILVSATSSKRR